MLAVIADSAGYPSGGLVNGRVVMAAVGVVVAVAALAGVGLSADGRPPWQIVVKVFALFAIETLGVVRALAAAVDHVGRVRVRVHARKRQAAGRVTVTGARTAHHHVVHGVVVLFLDLLSVSFMDTIIHALVVSIAHTIHSDLRTYIIHQYIIHHG